jgi:hypothetical protein
MKITSFVTEFADPQIDPYSYPNSSPFFSNRNSDPNSDPNDRNSVKKENCHIVRVGWVFSSKLNFPWKPVLAAAGETFHYLDTSSGKIVLYEETWKSKPWDVVKRLFTPTNF